MKFHIFSMDKMWTTKDVFFDLALVNKYFCRKYCKMIFVEETAKKKNSKIGDIVIKQYGDKTVVSKYPDMSNIIPSDSQKQKRSRFAEAVAYAKTINNSPILRNDLLKRVGGVRSVYQYALKEFLHRENLN